MIQVSANGAFTLDTVFPAGHSGRTVAIVQQPSSPTQNCLISNAAVSIQNANDTSVTVSCAAYSYVTNAADNTLSSYSIDATTGALATSAHRLPRASPLTQLSVSKSFLPVCQPFGYPANISSSWATRAAMTFPPLPSTTLLAH